jgi:hypothetical protein
MTPPDTIVEVSFNNHDATPKRRELHCRRRDVPVILQWYDGYHWGDNYTVRVDGVRVKVDENGDLVGWEP